MTDNELFEKQIALGWQGLSPPEGLKERVRARMWLSTSRWQALRASGPLGVGASALLIGLGFGAGYWVQPAQIVEVPAREARSAPSPEVTPAQPPQVTPPRVTPAQVSKRESVLERRETEEAPAAREPVSSPKAVAAPKPGPTEPSADGGELGLIQRSERALRAKNPELALALSGELAERYPQSALQEERRAILLMARCQAGATDTAAEREQFRERYPGSVYTDRIQNECKHAEPASP